MKYLILGAGGQLGKEFVHKLLEDKQNVISPPEQEGDITKIETIKTLVDQHLPNVVINCAAYNLVDDAEDNQELAFSINADAPNKIAKLCNENGILFVHYSTDYVFNGQKEGFYTEEDVPDPLSVYGESKLKGEEEILNHFKNTSLIFRTSWLIGRGQQNFLYKLNQWAANNHVLKISADETSVPTFTKTIVDVTLKAIDQKLRGLYHLTNSGYASRYELAKFFIEKMELDNLVIPVPMSTFQTKAKRPGFSAMSSTKLTQQLNISIPHWEDALIQYILEEDI